MGKPKGQGNVQDIFEQICKDVVEGKISFKQAVDNSNISRTQFYKQILSSNENKEMYNYAREVRSDYLFEEIVEIADTQEEGCTIIEKANGKETRRGDMTEHRRLRVDARKWVVARMNPKKYGDKLDVTSNNEAINQSITLNYDSKPISLKVDG
jgi:hypothetical protein